VYDKPVVTPAFAVVGTNLHRAGVVSYGPFFLCVIQKEVLRPSIINGLMMNEWCYDDDSGEDLHIICFYFITDRKENGSTI
jgi:hypothetical protein